MIAMWDAMFCSQNDSIAQHLRNQRGMAAFESMHKILDGVWREVDRILVPGGLCCINIGDATRTIDRNFCLYPNNQRVTECFIKQGHTALPPILWRKVTNTPNKFMGSGMMPPGAYVTLEHEWILIFRKGRKREFRTAAEKANRRESAYFWEERNQWFTDLWKLQGTPQRISNHNTRARSAAFPFEIPYRLINMFSVKGDVVYDPFLGTGTTTVAAIACERHSIGADIDEGLREVSMDRIVNMSVRDYRTLLDDRIARHNEFVGSYGKPMKYFNSRYNTPCVTRNEEYMRWNIIDHVEVTQSGFVAHYVEY